MYFKVCLEIIDYNITGCENEYFCNQGYIKVKEKWEYRSTCLLHYFVPL